MSNSSQVVNFQQLDSADTIVGNNGEESVGPISLESNMRNNETASTRVTHIALT